MLKKEIVSSLKEFVNETQRVIDLGELTLHQQLARTYRYIGQRHDQIEDASLFLRSRRRKLHHQGELVDVQSNMSLTERPYLLPLECDVNEDQDKLQALEIFFDCVSRFSADDSSIATERLRQKFSGSADYRFESLPSFLPEQYTVKGTFCSPIFTVAMKQSLSREQTQHFFLCMRRRPVDGRGSSYRLLQSVRERNQLALWWQLPTTGSSIRR